MKQRVLAITFLCCSSLLLGQNLVRNSSFEDIKTCPDSIGQFQDVVNHWSRPNIGTTDYFNSCSETVGLHNFFGHQEPHSGQGYVGLYFYAPKDYREYIQGSLTQPLKKEVTYRVCFYLNLADNSQQAINNLGVLFLGGELQNNKSNKFININKTLNKETKSFLVIVNNYDFYEDTEQWEEICFEYVAKGFETHFVVGNFDRNDQLIVRELKPPKLAKGAYYYIDDISIEQFIKTINTTNIISYKNLKNNTVYKLNNVFFDFNKHKLKPVSKQELDKLYIYLKGHKNLNVELYGHTDDVGSPQYNDELSLLRAKEVALYLISKGLNPNRFKATGYGTRYPISANNTALNRAQNRRVEFKLTKKQ